MTLFFEFGARLSAIATQQDAETACGQSQEPQQRENTGGGWQLVFVLWLSLGCGLSAGARRLCSRSAGLGLSCRRASSSCRETVFRKENVGQHARVFCRHIGVGIGPDGLCALTRPVPGRNFSQAETTWTGCCSDVGGER